MKRIRAKLGNGESQSPRVLVPGMQAALPSVIVSLLSVITACQCRSDVLQAVSKPGLSTAHGTNSLGGQVEGKGTKT